MSDLAALLDAELDLRKAEGFDPEKHKRYPANTPGGLGGQFAPQPGAKLNYQGWDMRVASVTGQSVDVEVSKGGGKEQHVRLSHQEFQAIKAASSAPGGVPSGRARQAALDKLPGGKNVGAARGRIAETMRQRRELSARAKGGDQEAVDELRRQELKAPQNTGIGARRRRAELDAQAARRKTAREQGGGRGDKNIPDDGVKRPRRSAAAERQEREQTAAEMDRKRQKAEPDYDHEAEAGKRNASSGYGEPAKGYSESEWKARGDNTKQHIDGSMKGLERAFAERGEAVAVSPSVGSPRITLTGSKSMPRWYVDPKKRIWKDGVKPDDLSPLTREVALREATRMDLAELRESRADRQEVHIGVKPGNKNPGGGTEEAARRFEAGGTPGPKEKLRTGLAVNGPGGEGTVINSGAGWASVRWDNGKVERYANSDLKVPGGTPGGVEAARLKREEAGRRAADALRGQPRDRPKGGASARAFEEQGGVSKPWGVEFTDGNGKRQVKNFSSEEARAAFISKNDSDITVHGYADPEDADSRKIVRDRQARRNSAALAARQAAREGGGAADLAGAEVPASIKAKRGSRAGQYEVSVGREGGFFVDADSKDEARIKFVQMALDSEFGVGVKDTVQRRMKAPKAKPKTAPKLTGNLAEREARGRQSAANDRSKADASRIDRISAQLKAGGLSESRMDALKAERDRLQRRLDRREGFGKSAAEIAEELRKNMWGGDYYEADGQPKGKKKRKKPFVKNLIDELREELDDRLAATVRERGSPFSKRLDPGGAEGAEGYKPKPKGKRKKKDEQPAGGGGSSDFEEKHPRGKTGTPQGGRFVPKEDLMLEPSATSGGSKKKGGSGGAADKKAKEAQEQREADLAEREAVQDEREAFDQHRDANADAQRGPEGPTDAKYKAPEPTAILKEGLPAGGKLWTSVAKFSKFLERGGSSWEEFSKDYPRAANALKAKEWNDGNRKGERPKLGPNWTFGKNSTISWTPKKMAKSAAEVASELELVFEKRFDPSQRRDTAGRWADSIAAVEAQQPDPFARVMEGIFDSKLMDRLAEGLTGEARATGAQLRAMNRDYVGEKGGPPADLLGDLTDPGTFRGADEPKWMRRDSISGALIGVRAPSASARDFGDKPQERYTRRQIAAMSAEDLWADHKYWRNMAMRLDPNGRDPEAGARKIIYARMAGQLLAEMSRRRLSYDVDTHAPLTKSARIARTFNALAKRFDPRQARDRAGKWTDDISSVPDMASAINLHQRKHKPAFDGLDFTPAAALPEEVETAENAYNAKANEIGPLWGEKDEAELELLAQKLRASYKKHGVDDIDRIQL